MTTAVLSRDMQRMSKFFDMPADGCWLWTGAQNQAGYGWVRYAGKADRAHRAVYMEMVGPIPEGLVLDHLCRVRHCVNPAHLEPVTRGENVRRGERKDGQMHCKQGHPLFGENLYTCNGKKQKRYCRTCQSASSQRYYLKKTGR